MFRLVSIYELFIQLCTATNVINSENCSLLGMVESQMRKAGDTQENLPNENGND